MLQSRVALAARYKAIVRIGNRVRCMRVLKSKDCGNFPKNRLAQDFVALLLSGQVKEVGEWVSNGMIREPEGTERPFCCFMEDTTVKYDAVGKLFLFEAFL